uniref:TIFA inhibitor n=1 Tax=Ailuropoda melanoleuca TaxID=9646 RepID=A0A7N5P6U0_AILME
MSGADGPLAVRLPSMETALTVLHVSLHDPAQNLDTFANVPPQLQHDTSPAAAPPLSRRHLLLEPYREKGSTLLTFCLKALSRKGCVWGNGLTLRFLEQVPPGMVNRVTFSGIQMVVHIEGGTSLEAFVCCFHLSPSPLVHRPQAEETDEWESTSHGKAASSKFRAVGSGSPRASPWPFPAKPWRRRRNTVPEGALRHCAVPAPPAAQSKPWP